MRHLLCCLLVTAACKESPPKASPPVAPVQPAIALADAAPPPDAVMDERARIDAHWTGTLKRSCGPMSVTRKQDDVGIPGAEVWAATPACTDMAGYRCVLTAADVFCEDETGAELQRVLRTFGLHSKPDALTDAQWVALVSTTVGAAVVRSEADLPNDKQNIPKAAKAKLGAPLVTRRKDGGAIINLVAQRRDLHTGKLTLADVRAVIDANGAVSVVRDPIVTF